MAAFTFVVLPDGRSILTTTRSLTMDELALVRERFQEWRDHRAATLIVEDCDVVQVLSLELDIPEPAA